VSNSGGWRQEEHLATKDFALVDSIITGCLQRWKTWKSQGLY